MFPPGHSDPISPLSFSSAFRARKQPSPRCGGHYWHRDWGPACADTAGWPGAFHFPSQVQRHSQMLLLPQADPSPRGGTPHPPFPAWISRTFPLPHGYSLSSSVPASPGIDLWQFPEHLPHLFCYLVAKLCLSLLPLHGLLCLWNFQAGILEWVAISFPRESS